MTALRVFGAWQVCPDLVNGASRAALVAVCQANDPDGEYDAPQGSAGYLSDAELRTIVLEWLADDYHVTNRG